MDLTPDIVQNLSIKVVTRFMSKQASLDEAIASEAKSNELNPDQIKRIIEASNSIAYLRQLQDATDRTFEFPVASYDGVMQKLVLPENMDHRDGVIASDIGTAQVVAEKQAELILDENKDYYISKIASEICRAKGSLEKFAHDKAALYMNITDLSLKVAQDKYAQEKIAMVTSDDSTKLVKIANLLPASNLATSLLFNKDELRDVTQLHDLYKQASDILEKEAEVLEFIENGEQFLKEAGFWGGALNFVKNPLESTSRGVAGAVGGLGKKLFGGFSNRQAIGRAASSAEKNFSPEIKAKIKAGKTTARDQVMDQFHQHSVTHGLPAAEAKFGFKKPGLVASIATPAVLTSAAFAPMMKHKTEVSSTLHPKYNQ